MDNHISSSGSDVSHLKQAPAPEGAASLHQDAGFGKVGDRSGNEAWSKMTGGKLGAGSGDGAGAGAGKDAGGTGSLKGGHIDFSDHGDIYGNAGMSAGNHGAGDSAAGTSAGAAGGAYDAQWAGASGPDTHLGASDKTYSPGAGSAGSEAGLGSASHSGGSGHARLDGGPSASSAGGDGAGMVGASGSLTAGSEQAGLHGTSSGINAGGDSAGLSGAAGGTSAGGEMAALHGAPGAASGNAGDQPLSAGGAAAARMGDGQGGYPSQPREGSSVSQAGDGQSGNPPASSDAAVPSRPGDGQGDGASPPGGGDRNRPPELKLPSPEEMANAPLAQLQAVARDSKQALDNHVQNQGDAIPPLALHGTSAFFAEALKSPGPNELWVTGQDPSRRDMGASQRVSDLSVGANYSIDYANNRGKTAGDGPGPLMVYDASKQPGAWSKVPDNATGSEWNGTNAGDTAKFGKLDPTNAKLLGTVSREQLDGLKSQFAPMDEALKSKQSDVLKQPGGPSQEQIDDISDRAKVMYQLQRTHEMRAILDVVAGSSNGDAQ